jgi:flagellar motor switch protein FliG
VALEHIEGGMPVVELHRNHGVPFASVKQWIALYKQREAIQQNADAIQQKLETPITSKERAKLIAQRANSDADVVTEAIINTGLRQVDALVPRLLDLLNDERHAITIIRALQIMKAKDALAQAKTKLGPRFASWF